jgi:hypothetical protein
LSTNSKVDEVLRTWKKEATLVRAEHFFWIMGDHTQKTREGLLRHLLYCSLPALRSAVVGNDFQLAKHVCGSRWDSNTHLRPWSYEQLRDIMLRLVSSSNIKVFYLIDALDECDPQDRLWELAGEVLKLSQLPNFKLCVSCRPWSPFVQKFQHAQILHLDQLTYQDMELYIENRLADSGGEVYFCSEFRDPGRTARAAKFASEVARSSEGVFLWTELVLKALVSEMRKHGDFTHLEKTLLEFPVGLNEYFQRFILERITKTRQNTSDTAAALMLGLKISKSPGRENDDEPPEPRSFINFWLLRGGYLKPGFSWTDHEDIRYSPEDAKRMVRQTGDFLEETCKELLVLVDRRSDDSKQYSELFWDVEFLHRTAADFLYGDRVRLILEQQSPDLFNDENFIVRLGKLRCIHLIRELMMGCGAAEDIFTSMISASQQLLSRDRAWLLKCEALMIERHQRACRCLGEYHWSSTQSYIVRTSTAVGLTEYLLAITASWPHLVLQRPNRNILHACLLGWLDFVWKEICIQPNDQILRSSIRKMENSWYHMLRKQDDAPGPQRVVPAPLTTPSMLALGCSRTKLLKRLLECGLNPNQRDSDRLETCPGSFWQSWLRSAHLRLKQQDQDACPPARRQVQSEHVKRKIGDVIMILLQHGADSTGTMCTSDHINQDDSCDIKSLMDVLGSITGRNCIDEVQISPAVHTIHFDRDSIRRVYMLRAMASWKVTVRDGYRISEGATALDPEAVTMFLHSFIANQEGLICSVCAKWNESYLGFAVASCLDCNGRYYLCELCVHEQFPEGPVHSNVLSQRLVHERPSSAAQHTHLSFGYRYGNPRNYYGVETALSVLEDWYSRNTNGVDAALD